MNALKELRLEKKISQNQLANAIQVTPKYISFLENGERTPSLDIAKKIASYFGKTIEEVFLP
jgi:putative transcriptional regulator